MSHVNLFLIFSLSFFLGGGVVKPDGGGSVINGANTVLIHKGKNLLVFGHYPKKGKWREWGVSNPNIKLKYAIFFPSWNCDISQGVVVGVHCAVYTVLILQTEISKGRHQKTSVFFLLDIVQK